MTKMRYGSSFLISSVVYTLIGLLSLSFLEHSKVLKKPKEPVIKIAIITPIPEIIPPKVITPPVPMPLPPVIIPPKKIEKPKPKKIIKKVIKKPKPKPKKIIKKPKPKPKPKPKKVIKKITPQPKPVPQEIIEAPEAVYSYTPPVEKVVQPVARPQRVQPTVRVQPKVDKSAEKKAFLNQVRSKIIANKKYSRIALRRHIEGSVKVKFDITANGSVSNIRFINGKSILQKSVRNAINKSFPIGIPNRLNDQFPMYNISVTVNFKIN